MKKIILGFIALLVSATLFAAPRTIEEAAEIAAQFTNSQPQLRKAHKAPRAAANMRLAHKALQLNSEKAAFYVFNQENENGFIIVSADDRTADEVLGYTDNGSFDANNINPNLKFWLNRYADEITVLQTIDDSDIITEPQARKAMQVTAIAPLLKNAAGQEITWYQEAPYYNYCPIDQRDNTRSLTGCVATATAAIMYKWQHPAQGHGTHSYTWKDCKNDNCSSYTNITITSNFDTVYFDWNNMLPAYEGVSASTAQKRAVASLMYNVGVATNMQYGGDANGGSGAWTDDMAYGLQTYFDYEFDKFITMYSQSNYGTAAVTPAEYSVTRDQFTSYFNADLEAGRPILMGGEDSSGGGHEFVCDGRDSNNKFHINWGWEGSGNGYFAISALKPTGSSYNFSTNLDALIGLRPVEDPEPVYYTIRFFDQGVQIGEDQVVLKNDQAQAPANPTPACEGYTFVGWWTEELAAENTSAKSWVTNFRATKDQNYYAVYKKTVNTGDTAPTDTYQKITSTSDLTSGNYVVAGYYNNTYAAMKNSLYKNYYIAQQVVTPNNDEITTTDGGIIWQITVNGNSLSFYNAAVDQYVHIYQSGTYTNAGLTTSASDNIHFTYTVNNGSWDFVNTAITGKNHLEYYGKYSEFTAYSQAGDPIYLYKQQIGDGTTTYYSTVVSCSGTDVENTTVKQAAVKVIENGQVIIIRDNEKYSIYGQKIQ